MSNKKDFFKNDILHNIPKGDTTVCGAIRIKTYYYRGASIGEDTDNVGIDSGWMYSTNLYTNSAVHSSSFYKTEKEASIKGLQVAEALLATSLRALRHKMKESNIKRLSEDGQ
jgi:hypothetical protein